MYGLDEGKDSVTVTSQKLEALCEAFDLAKIHILKLDCKGAEYDILYCLNTDQLNRVAYITMETHQIDEDRKNRDALVSWLNGKDWKTDVIRSKVLATNPNFKV